MEKVKPHIIPTNYRAKISHELSFPIGAERISIALAEVPQLELLNITFLSNYSHAVPAWELPFLTVRYANIPKMREFVKPDGSLYFHAWSIDVRPVQRELRHRIQTYIVNSALPAVACWLVERGDLRMEGRDELNFTLDMQKDEFVTGRVAQLQPEAPVGAFRPDWTASSARICWPLNLWAAPKAAIEPRRWLGFVAQQELRKGRRSSVFRGFARSFGVLLKLFDCWFRRSAPARRRAVRRVLRRGSDPSVLRPGQASGRAWRRSRRSPS